MLFGAGSDRVRSGRRTRILGASTWAMPGQRLPVPNRGAIGARVIRLGSPSAGKQTRSVFGCRKNHCYHDRPRAIQISQYRDYGVKGGTRSDIENRHLATVGEKRPAPRRRASSRSTPGQGAHGGLPRNVGDIDLKNRAGTPLIEIGSEPERARPTKKRSPTEGRCTSTSPARHCGRNTCGRPSSVRLRTSRPARRPERVSAPLRDQEPEQASVHGEGGFK